jgi:beta-glucanase (GH16 family)
MIVRIICILFVIAGAGTATADTQQPSAPDNVQAASLSSTSIRVSWNRPWDNVGVDGYNVYRDGSYRSTVFDTNYVDGGAESGRSYRYSVVAFDAARNFSVRSAEQSVTSGSAAGSPQGAPQAAAPATGAPGTPGGVGVQALGNGSVQVSWDNAGGNVAGYSVYRDNSYRGTVRGTNNYTDSGVNANQTYSYQVVSFSNDGRFSPKSAAVNVNTGGAAAQPVNDDPAPTRGSSVPAGYSLVFSDEFNGGSVDSSKWNTRYRWGPNWIINNEQQYYVDTLNNPSFGHSPFEFGGGNMTINAIRTPGHLWGSANSQPWLSGALTTFGKFKMRYGYVEMRARLPAGQGLWPAFWLLHQHDHDRRPEIDVVEMLGGNPNTVYQTYHYYDNYTLRSTPSFTVNNANYSSGFHTYGMKWEPGRIIWYVDGQETNRFEDGNVSWEEMYILVNLAVGGAWGGNADGNTPSPSRFTIDYIRAYQQ